MNLSPGQIDSLKKLISYKGYPEIDVQYEILDHVACRVEELMNQNPKLSLNEAFAKAHGEFGVFGFSELEESYKKVIQKRVIKNFSVELKDLFTSLRIIYPLGLGFIFHQSSVLLGNSNLWLILMVGFVLIASIGIISKYWSKSKAYRKYASFQVTALWFQLLNLGIICAFNAYQFVLKSPQSLFEKVFSGIILLVLGVMFVSIFIIPKVVNQSIRETEKLKAIYET
ncbi:hypothetical protein [Algoriphagus sediminis]|uniref:DUF1129 family protein n=1 Tax=Algoriphagus sediminis TaxID=3057113 RepID=A0ABT7YH06_9BACT|nr:hypothetical protein [Algoriphagus sediminis]MDN3205789.1 hypothetical protein [Algoriphagus sediminis]